MSIESMREKLRELAENGPWRSETAGIAHLLESIEKALAVGVRRKEILETLHKCGYTLTLRGLETSLYRLRKRKKAASSPKAKAVESIQLKASR